MKLFNKKEALKLLLDNYIVGKITDNNNGNLSICFCLNDLVEKDNYYRMDNNGNIFDKFDDPIDLSDLPSGNIYYIKNLTNADFIENMIFMHKHSIIEYILEESDIIKNIGIDCWLKKPYSLK